MDKNNLNVGKKLKIAREKANLTQMDVAYKAGISVSYYSGMERDLRNPTLSVFKKVVKALKTKSSKILDF